MADLELAAAAAVVAASAEAEVGAAATDEVSDDLVAGAIEHTAVVEIRTSRDNEESGSWRPRLLEEGRLCQGDDCIVGREQAAQGVDALPDRGDCRASA